MAKKSMIAREVKRAKQIDKYKPRRDALRSKVVDTSISNDERWQAMMELQKLPRDSNASRKRNRCALTGRPRGYYRKFGLSRNKLREIIMSGDVPGVVKSSW
jgi:small subunit ribosomal protein S14